MSLPKISQPTYTMFFHSVKKDVEFRPFTVGEEKILLMVSDSKDPKFIVTNLRKVLQGCILDPTIDLARVAGYDIENLLLKIKAKSSGETVNIKFKDPDSDEIYTEEINLEELEVNFSPDHIYDIKINDTTGLKMKDISFDRMLEYQSAGADKSSIIFDIVIDCVDAIYTDEEVFKVGDQITRTEAKEFIENLSGISQQLYKFIETMPSVSYKVKLKSGKEHLIKDVKNFLS